MTEQELANIWNSHADEFNQWDTLGLDEKLEFAIRIECDACAKVIEEYPHWLGRTAKAEISAAIRARGEK
jgi:hypothetical protein